MQINVVEYLERGALATCPHKTAIIDGAHRYTFAEVPASSEPLRLMRYYRALWEYHAA